MQLAVKIRTYLYNLSRVFQSTIHIRHFSRFFFICCFMSFHGFFQSLQEDERIHLHVSLACLTGDSNLKPSLGDTLNKQIPVADEGT